jgi:anaerobic dimethyl sulfoxide reductase subunit B (iron-sulfur subunit)
MTARQYGFYIHTDRCVQCHACEMACKSHNGVEPGVRWRRVIDAWGGRFPDVTNRSISFSCMHCGKPACLDACPEHAISKRAEDGIVVVDPRKCIGCRSCAAACPFHVPQYGRTGIMQKCDLCLGRIQQGKLPSCVATCPGEALKFGAMDELAEVSSAKSGRRLSAPTDPAFFISGKLTGEAFLEMLESNMVSGD